MVKGMTSVIMSLTAACKAHTAFCLLKKRRDIERREGNGVMSQMVA